jgi:hypothetical protein
MNSVPSAFLVLLATVATLVVSPQASQAQSDACKTVNRGHSSAACEHRGAGCNIGSGPATGRCLFLPSDGLCDCEPIGGAPGATVTGKALSSPVYVNLYWDAQWDADNPSMTKDQMDGFMAALLSSKYFGGLSEYGVGAPSFQGGFLPAGQCTQKAPSRVGFYAPTGASIMGFLQCELDHGDLPQGSQVVYNVIMPSGSLESDFFGERTFCQGGPNAWHFHQTPYTTEAKVALGLGLLGGITGGPTGALEAFLAVLELLDGGPIYTISSVDPQCGNFIANLTHEMVETASDPFPPSHVILTGSDEVADICDDRGAPPSVPFVPQTGRVLAPNPSFPTSSSFTTANTISVSQYWSNASQTCLTGFTDSTLPSGPNAGPLQAAISGNGADISITITGSGFGVLPNPPAWNPPWSVNLPYLAIQNETRGWQAGNSLNSDFVTLNIASWSDTAIAIKGFNFNTGNLVMQPKDNLSYWVCNPASGKCGFGNVTLVESGLPQLKVFVDNMPNVNLTYDVLVDGTKVAGPVANHFSTGWLSFSGSPTVTVTENATSPAFFTPEFIAGCDPNGNIALKPGDNQICTILNIAATGCASGQHCCSNPTSSRGCASGCLALAVACEPLCPKTGEKCCGGTLSNGRCDGACVKAPAQSCQ